MKVMHLLTSDRFSGAENVVCQIFNLFKDDENIEMIYCSRDGQIREELSRRNIKFVPIKSPTVKEVRRVIKEQKPDVIHAHDMKASLIAALSCGKIKLISHIHNNNFNSRGLSLKSIGYLMAAIKAKHIFWVSESSFKGYAFHGLLKEKSEILYNIIDVDSLYEKMLLDKNNYNFDVIFIGRLTRQKNPIRLVNVFKTILERKPDMRIAVLGTGDLDLQVKEEAKKLGIAEKINFLGFQTNPYKILHDSKVMLMTSLWEGTPMCVLEALILGVPVVSTPVDGITAVVQDGETGFLSDNDEELANKCVLLVENKEIHNKMAESCKKSITNLMDNKKYKNAIEKEYLLEKRIR